MACCSQRRVILWVGAALAFSIAATCFVLMGTLGVGIIDVKVTLKSQASNQIRRIDFRESSNLEHLQHFAESKDPPNPTNYRSKLYEGKAVSLPVIFTTRSYCCGLYERKFAPKHIAIRVEYIDGKLHGVVRDIPSDQLTTEMEIEVP